MYKKLCPNCQKPSFSSCDTGKWICPNCNQNLTYAKLHDAESRNPDHPHLFLVQKRYSLHNPKSLPLVRPYIFKSYD